MSKKKSYSRSNFTIVWEGVSHSWHKLHFLDLSPTTGLFLSQPVMSWSLGYNHKYTVCEQLQSPNESDSRSCGLGWSLDWVIVLGFLGKKHDFHSALLEPREERWVLLNHHGILIKFLDVTCNGLASHSNEA